MWRTRTLYVAALAAFSTLLLAGGPAGGAFLTHESGSFGGQRGASMDFGSMADSGWIRHYTTWPNAETDEIHLYSPTQGEAFVKTLQEAAVDLDGSHLSIWQHGQVKSESYPWPLGTVHRRWQVGSGSGNQAHADSFCQDMAFRIEPGEDEAVGDPVSLTFNAHLAVNHRLNDQLYHDWTAVDLGDDGSIDFEMKGQLDGGWPDPYTVFLTPADEAEPRPVLQAAENHTRSAAVFNNATVDARVGDLITFRGGPLVWQTIDTWVYGNEKVTSDIQFSIDVDLRSSSDDGSSVIMDYGFDDMGDFEETGFGVDSAGGEGAASLTPLPGGAPGNRALRLFDPDGPMWISRMIDADEILEIDLDYWFGTEGRLTIFLDGVELTSVESDEVVPPALSNLSESFVLADYGLGGGQLLLELKLSNPWNPDPELYLDNLYIATVPEPACGMLLLGSLGLVRRRRKA